MWPYYLFFPTKFDDYLDLYIRKMLNPHLNHFFQHNNHLNLCLQIGEFIMVIV